MAEALMGYSKVGILLPFLWRLMTDNILWSLYETGVYIQGYEYDTISDSINENHELHPSKIVIILYARNPISCR